jgi:glycosyltransferase involved in cell wall biosynthesis
MQSSGKIEPLVSVALCTYNGEEWLRPQLSSILDQTHQNLELVIIDDASTDGTVAIINEYADKDPRIQFQVNAENLGYNRNFEKAIRLCNAELIAVSDQDDVWLPNKIETMIPYFTGDTILVHSYNADFKGDGHSAKYFNPSRTRFQGNKTRQLIFYNTVSGHSMIIHKKLLPHIFPFPTTVYYDWWTGIHASLQGEIKLHPEVLVWHRQHESNASQMKKNTTREELKEMFFAERISILESFKEIPGLKKDDKDLLEEYISLLSKEKKKKFSWPLFFFFLKYANDAFYFRTKKPRFYYHLKYSFKRASMKVDNWT